MFCPKCGNDCGDNRFCVRCGAQVQESQTNNVYEGKDSYEVPTGKFKSSSGYLRLEKCALIIGDRGDLFKKEVTIPYDKLITVLYVRSQTRLGSPGFLIDRWEGNRNKPMPVGLARYGDRTSVSFTQREYLMFYHIYCFLKTVAPYSAQFKMERHTPDTCNRVERCQGKCRDTHRHQADSNIFWHTEHAEETCDRSGDDLERCTAWKASSCCCSSHDNKSNNG